MSFICVYLWFYIRFFAGAIGPFCQNHFGKIGLFSVWTVETSHFAYKNRHQSVFLPNEKILNLAYKSGLSESPFTERSNRGRRSER